MTKYSLVLLATLAGFASAAEHFVGPNGRPSASGTLADPWDLSTALSHPRQVLAGDTIWVRAGVYKGFFISKLAGSSRAPIIVRAYGDERAILDRAGLDSQNRSNLTIAGPYAWFWGLEITNTDSTRVFTNSYRDCFDHQHCRPPAINVFGPGSKLINLVIHDTGDGIGMWSQAVDAEAYGNIVFFTGWQNEVRGNGHAIYAQNGPGTKRVIDNVLFSGFHSGIHMYGSSEASLRNLHIEGNTIFNTGLLAADPNGWGILVGGGVRADNITISNNCLYNPEWFRRSNNVSPSYGKGTESLVLENNYSAGYKAMGSDLPVGTLRASGNVFAGFIDPALLSQVRNEPGNTIAEFSSLRGSLNRVFVRRNRYEPHKATVTVYNWKGTDQVALDLSSLLEAGDRYEIRDLQNIFAEPLKAGVSDGKPITVPMNSGAAAPIGIVPGKNYRSSIEFGVFQVKIVRNTLPAPKKVFLSEPAVHRSHKLGASVSHLSVLSLSSGENAAASWTAKATHTWLRMSHAEGSTPDRLRVGFDVQGLSPGTHEAGILVTADGGDVQLVPVKLSLEVPDEAPIVDTVVNSASSESTMAEGLMISIRGCNLESQRSAVSPDADTGGTTVTIGGMPALLVSVSIAHVLALVPKLPSIQPGEPVDVVVKTDKGRAVMTVHHEASAVGIFELPGTNGHVAASHSDGSIVSHLWGYGLVRIRPALPGDVVSLYLTGTAKPVDNLNGPSSESTVVNEGIEISIGGKPALIASASIISPGLEQINLVVPDVASGPQPVRVTYRGAESQAAAYLPIAR